MSRKRKINNITSDEAIHDILRFVENEDSGEESDIEDLFGDDTNIQLEIQQLYNKSDDSESDDELIVEPATKRTHKRKTLTYKRLVNSIDSALDENNFQLFDVPQKEVTIKGELPDPSSKKKTAKKKITFTNQPRISVGRQNSSNVISNKPGVAACARHIDNPKEAFNFFLPPEFIDNTVIYTNKRIEETISKCRDTLNNSDKYPHVKIVDSIDIYAAIGLMYFRGLYGMNMHSTHILFSPKQGPPPFGATMSRLRFHFICSHLCFYNPDTITERWKHDRFAAMREIFSECNKNFARALIPEDYLTIDETLYPMRNQISFKQYNPDKPAKYGMLYKSINSARYPFTHQSHVYCGKPEQEPDENYVSGTINYVKYLVEKFSEHQNLTGRNISMDRLYTSFEVANWLAEKK